MSRYWVSWWEPDHAARHEAAEILGEWCSGHRERSHVERAKPVSEASIVALVAADSDAQAQYIIESTHSVIEWRFRDVVGDDWVPGNRFPMPETT